MCPQISPEKLQFYPNFTRILMQISPCWWLCPQRPTASVLVHKRIGSCIIFIQPSATHSLLPAGNKQGHVFHTIICPLVPYDTHIYILKHFSYTIIFIWPTAPHCLWPSKEKNQGHVSFSYGPQRPTASYLLKKIRGMCLNQLYALWCHTSHKYIFINIFPILSFSYGPPRPTASWSVHYKIKSLITPPIRVRLERQRQLRNREDRPNLSTHTSLRARKLV